jgi:hypothetical protein
MMEFLGVMGWLAVWLFMAADKARNDDAPGPASSWWDCSEPIYPSGRQFDIWDNEITGDK